MSRSFLAGLVILTQFVGFSWAGQQAQTLVNESPQVMQSIGRSEARLDPGLYPKFNTKSEKQTETVFDEATNTNVTRVVIPDDPQCDEYLNNNLSGKPANTIPEHNGYSGKAITAYSGGYVTIGDGLLIKDFIVPKEYRKTAKIRIDWTVRIEGQIKFIDPLKPGLCQQWEIGSNSQTFNGGDAKTKLFVTVGGQVLAKGTEFVMHIPDAGTKTVVTNPPPIQPLHDPTLVGSYLMTPDDFAGELPEKLSFEVKWLNETSQELVSPANMRNLVVTLVPTSKE